MRLTSLHCTEFDTALTLLTSTLPLVVPLLHRYLLNYLFVRQPHLHHISFSLFLFTLHLLDRHLQISDTYLFSSRHFLFIYL